jgi:hypothetical protein
MNYAVDWAPDALSALAAAWMQAPDRQAVTAAQARIDQRLATDPLGNSTPVSEGLYAINEPPLRALFEVSISLHQVRVVSVEWLP